MPTMVLKSAGFDAMEGFFNPPDVTWSNEDAFGTLINNDTAGALKVLQLSSSLIRVSQAVWDWSTGTPTKVTYELRLSGSGISPVSTLGALMDAINNGMANGTLSKLEILQGNTGILAVTMDAAGYHLTSGDVSVALTGTLPLTFTQFADIAQLFDRVANIDMLNKAERVALFNDLSVYSVTGLSLTDGGTTLFAVHVGATTASLTLNGLTLTATGTFPDNLGEDVQALWDIASAYVARGVSVTGFAGLSITGLTIKDASGKLIASMADPLADTPLVTKVDGKVYDAVAMGDNGDNYLREYARDKVVLAGLDGRDQLIGGIKGDYLLGGTDNDILTGNGGADKLDGGAGHDVLTGGAGADVFHFDLNDGYDRITDFTVGADVIQLLDASRMADLTLTQTGNDVQIDYRTIHILVEGVTLQQMDMVANFQF